MRLPWPWAAPAGLSQVALESHSRSGLLVDINHSNDDDNYMMVVRMVVVRMAVVVVTAAVKTFQQAA